MKSRDIAIGVLLLIAGYWLGSHVSVSKVKPTTQSGTVGTVSQDGSAFTFTANGSSTTTSYALGIAAWRDSAGVWHLGTRPGCMAPDSHGQRVTLGLVRSVPFEGAPGATTVAWIECP